MKVLPILLCLASPVAAQTEWFSAVQPCDKNDRVIAALSEYREAPLFTAEMYQTNRNGEIYPSGAILQVNQDTGTWSLLSVWPDGRACIVAAGTGFEPYSK